MSMAQSTRELSPSGDPRCPRCNTLLPRQATFCASCGERIVTQSLASLLQDDAGITTRYRITSLVRRRSYVSLLFALDNQQARPVAIRDIDITSLSQERQLRAYKMVQQECDVLRREHITSMMPVIDVRHFQGHLYVISGWPLQKQGETVLLHTLQDVLQSGIGLPDTQVSLSWIEQLCRSIDHLHHQGIVLGDLDPQALILGGEHYGGLLELMVSWLPPTMRDLLPSTSVHSNSSHYSAPEVLRSRPEPRSDVYSLGAILYILLTGIPPDEAATRIQRRLRTPSEVNPRTYSNLSNLDEFVMKALALESSERFQDIHTMAVALAHVRGRKRPPSYGAIPTRPSGAESATPAIPDTQAPLVQADATQTRNEHTIDEIMQADTITAMPLPAANSVTWQATKTPAKVRPLAVEAHPIIVEGAIEHRSTTKESIKKSVPANQTDEDEVDLPIWRPTNPNNGIHILSPVTRSLRERITGLLPAIPRSPAPKSSGEQEDAVRPLEPTSSPTQKTSLLKQLQQIILGEQKHSTTAAATIELPLRVQPEQAYLIRIQLMGRSTPRAAQSSNAPASGLSSLVEGQSVSIEVRSALYQNFAYIVQQATVHIPAAGFAAEVTIPMKSLSNGPSGRRDRLHIFFMDELRRPLYEKPFVIEVFISHLVQPGREGHNVLTIPL